MTGQVCVADDITITLLAQIVADRFGLTPAMLDQQPAAGLEKITRVLREMADDVESVGAGGEGSDWFEANIALFQMRGVNADVRRVAQDHVAGFAGERGAPGHFTNHE